MNVRHEPTVLVSVQIADLALSDSFGVLRAQQRLSRIPGATFAVTMLAVPLRSTRRPQPPNPHRVGVIIGWSEASAHARFLAEDPIAARLQASFGALLEPLRVWGQWQDAGEIRTVEQSDDEPVAALTLGRLRLRRGAAFLAASLGAERRALSHPGLLMGRPLYVLRSCSRPSRCGTRSRLFATTRPAAPPADTVTPSALTASCRSITRRCSCGCGR